MLIDSHCHLHDREFFSAAQAAEMLERADRNDVRKIVCIGTDAQDSLAARDFAKQTNAAKKSAFPQVFWTFGVHPEAAKNLALVKKIADESVEQLTKIMQNLGETKTRKNEHSAPVAIGEVGLDYHYPDYDREAQIRLFEAMLQLAIDYDLPLSFHIREAFDDFFGVISNFSNLRGVVHSFTDSKKNLKRILSQTDFYIGVNGLATYSTLPTPPLERILLETDAPFLTPVPFRGIINEPGYVRQVAEWLAAKLEQEYQTVAEVTTQNVERIFHL